MLALPKRLGALAGLRSSWRSARAAGSCAPFQVAPGSCGRTMHERTGSRERRSAPSGAELSASSSNSDEAVSWDSSEPTQTQTSEAALAGAAASRPLETRSRVPGAISIASSSIVWSLGGPANHSSVLASAPATEKHSYTPPCARHVKSGAWSTTVPLPSRKAAPKTLSKISADGRAPSTETIERGVRPSVRTADAVEGSSASPPPSSPPLLPERVERTTRGSAAPPPPAIKSPTREKEGQVRAAPLFISLSPSLSRSPPGSLPPCPLSSLKRGIFKESRNTTTTTTTSSLSESNLNY
eukprot:scaffold95681_cov31-Tisochrysis_lutea.AAC.4